MEELDALRFQLEALKLEATKSSQRFDSEKHQLEQTGKLETLAEEFKASQTVLQLAVAKREDTQTIETEMQSKELGGGTWTRTKEHQAGSGTGLFMRERHRRRGATG
ncbi:hypothetical protein F443_02530 [Phytophthora nicotianae P1569]|uniref:Uncharacterized protein n=1 Tax=Phytophthora nicotianae P1569 TaxID=1317065 RepID=V9FT98_PHYNI|nr:hypothetical protein F443_02530 [Phytophthora nicotianae P1569]